MRAPLSPAAAQKAADPARFDKTIKGVSLMFTFSSADALHQSVSWAEHKPAVGMGQSTLPSLEDRRFIMPSSEVDVYPFVLDLVKKRFKLTSMTSTKRDMGFSRTGYRVKFLLHSKVETPIDPEYERYLRDVGVPSLERAVREAVWTADMLHNPLKDGTGFGFSLGCKERRPYRLSNGEQNMFRKEPVKPALTLRIIKGRVVLV
ncbi:MAG TPA: hypothetical protein VJL39_02885 [Candidatus Paceibacterota bacterium]